MITLSRDDGPMRQPLIVNDDGRDILVQTDYDYPGVASSFGWVLRSVQSAPWRVLTVDGCDHIGTDGTIACPDCGADTTLFIASARDYLDDHIGATADDPGYFD